MPEKLTDFSEDDLRLFQIFYPYAFEKTVAAINSDQKFVHYCDAAAAMSMIQHKEVWMRNATWMNDHSEIKYGADRLFEAAESPHGQRLKDTLNGVFPDFGKEFDAIFVPWVEDFEQETYITCFSEELINEDSMGRLSMWRAYGAGKIPVALVVNGGPMLRPSSALNAYTSPVAYLSSTEFQTKFGALADNIGKNLDFLVSMGRQVVLNHLFAAFRFAVICTKHPSFYEEHEWRVIHQPNFEPSNRLIEETRVIGNHPQKIFKIKLEDHPEENFVGAELTSFLIRVMIGPEGNADGLRREFIKLLEAQKIENAEQKVVISDVPLRA